MFSTFFSLEFPSFSRLVWVGDFLMAFDVRKIQQKAKRAKENRKTTENTHNKNRMDIMIRFCYTGIIILIIKDQPLNRTKMKQI